MIIDVCMLDKHSTHENIMRTERFAIISGTTPARKSFPGLSGKRVARIFCGLCMMLALGACSSISPQPTRVTPVPGRGYNLEMPKAPPTFANREQVEAMAPKEPFQYRIGPGDVMNIKVWRRPELSLESITVSPDGNIVVPRAGLINVANDTSTDVEKKIVSKLEVLYIQPEVSVIVREFHNNRAFVLGRVTRPGVINFPGSGTLLEGIALAGGVPDREKLSRCSIIRGNDSVIWIDLQDLLRNGNMSLNAPIRNNDVIFIPEYDDELVYVMGEVRNPGALKISDGMSVLKAVMLAGGMNSKADPKKVFIIRQQQDKGDVIAVDLNSLVGNADFSRNFTLLPNDIIYVSPSGMAKFNYALEKLMPSLQVLNLGVSIGESLGLMQEMRQKLWNQSGFVNSSSTTTTTTNGNK
jgi:polysaccharide biosynthesis/export protein